jgi:hypothetical protein
MIYRIADSFTRYPAGRYKSDGPYTGEALREILIKLLKEEDQVYVVLDGALGYASTFLEECFGGIIREGVFDYTYLQKHMTLVSSEYPRYALDSWKYILDAEQRLDRVEMCQHEWVFDPETDGPEKWCLKCNAYKDE